MSTDQKMLASEKIEVPASEREWIRQKLSRAPKLYIGKLEFRFDTEELDDEYKEMAARDLNETPEKVKEALEILRELLKGEPDLYIPTSDEYLFKFLRPCKWYAKSAFELIKRFHKYRQSHPRYFENLKPSNDSAVLLAGLITPIPRRTYEGVRVVVVEGGKKWKPKEIPLDQFFRGLIIFLEAAMAEARTQVAGVRVLLNMEGLPLSHVPHFTPSFAAAVVDFVQRCLPCRLKGIHIINQPIIFSMVFAFFKPFLHEKLRKRIHFHGSDKQSLMKYIDAKALPKQFGGELDYPDEPVGEPFLNFLTLFDDLFVEAAKRGYPKKA